MNVPRDARAEGDKASVLASPKTRGKATVLIGGSKVRGHEESKVRDGQEAKLSVKANDCNIITFSL